MTEDLHLYSAFGLSIASELPLPELPPGSGEPQVVIRCGVVPFTAQPTSRTEQFFFNSSAGHFHVRDGTRITVQPREGANHQLVNVFLLGRVMASLLTQRGWLPLHASGVIIEGRAALFLGQSGAGKSTLAAALHNRGHVVMTDDVAPVRIKEGNCEVLSGWSRLRLSPESMTLMAGRTFETVLQDDKYSLDLGRPSLPPFAPLGRIYLLASGTEFRSAVVPPLQATASLSIHAFIRTIRCSTDVIQLHLERCAALAEKHRVIQLCRRKTFVELTTIAQYIEKDMEMNDVGN